jgi:hypothetical protein
MDDLTMVFRGTHAFTFTLPQNAEVEGEDYRTIDTPGFEAVCAFRQLDQLQATDEPAFTHAQAICVTDVEDWDFRGGEFASVLALPEAVRWILCFPVQGQSWELRGREGRYAPQTRSVILEGGDIFYTFTSLASAAPASASVQAVPCLNDLNLLVPQPGDKLVVIRAKDWSWDDRRQTAYILPWDISEIEFVVESEVRVF